MGKNNVFAHHKPNSKIMMDAASNRLRLAAYAKDIASENLKNAQALVDAARVAAAATRDGLMAASAHNKQAKMDVSKISVDRMIVSLSMDPMVNAQQSKRIMIATYAYDSAKKTLAAARNAFEEAKRYDEEARARFNDILAGFIFI